MTRGGAYKVRDESSSSLLSSQLLWNHPDHLKSIAKQPKGANYVYTPCHNGTGVAEIATSTLHKLAATKTA